MSGFYEAASMAAYDGFPHPIEGGTHALIWNSSLFMNLFVSVLIETIYGLHLLKFLYMIYIC